MSRSVASNLLDATQLFMIAGVACGVFLIWKNWQQFSDWLNPYPEIREAMEESPTGRFFLRIQDAREIIPGPVPVLEFPDIAVLLRSLPITAPSPGFQLSDLYAHTAEVGPRMGPIGGVYFEP